MKKLTIARGMIASVIGVLLLWVNISALPTPTQFELEGNAIVDGTGDDWANTVPTKTASSEALVSTFIADGSGNATIFTGGGAKDIQDISSWKWKNQLGGLPDKDNITNAYAAAYATANGDLTIYFGADRFATAGDAQLGFWFFHQRVQAVNDQFVGADGVTPASHTLGDILVLANFENGGTVATVQVFKWVGGSNPLLLVGGSATASAKCGVNTDPNVCAITNIGDMAAPWPYVPKVGTPGTFPEVSFFEGGINISAFINTQAAGCFSSFLAETRSSTSTSATLKDFALGEFNTCDIDIAKACPTVTHNAETNLLTYTSEITVTNKGFGTVFDVTVNDTPSAPASPAQFTLASLDRNASHTFTHTFTYTSDLTTPNPPSNTATVTAAVNPGGLQIIDGGSATAQCPRVEFDANLTITKACVTRLEVQNNRVVVVVDISGEVCNVLDPENPDDVPSPIDNVTVTDTPPITPIDLGTLASGECKNYSATYFPNTLIGGSGLPHDQRYEDTVSVTGKSRFDNQEKMNTATANCPLCP